MEKTLLRHINGLLKPDRGTVEVFGQPIDYTRLVELRHRMGYAVQSVGLFPHLRVADNMSLAARLSGWSAERIRTRSAQLMQSMRLADDLANRFPHELSGGQRQRISICRAMMLDPDLLLLDEPFSGVDPITRVRIHDEFLALMEKEPATAVLVTHDVREAVRLASHMIIMRQGRIVQQDHVEKVLAEPATDDIRRLFHEQLD